VGGVGVKRRVKPVEHRVELADVIVVLVGQHDAVEPVDAGLVERVGDNVVDARHRAGVEGRRLAGHEVRVAGELLRVRSDGDRLHTRTKGARWEKRAVPRERGGGISRTPGDLCLVAC